MPSCVARSGGHVCEFERRNKRVSSHAAEQRLQKTHRLFVLVVETEAAMLVMVDGAVPVVPVVPVEAFEWKSLVREREAESKAAHYYTYPERASDGHF